MMTGAEESEMTVRVGLVGCVKQKVDHPAPARELYVSPLFRGRRRYVENSCDTWLILSAKHGLLDLDQLVEPYDQSLVTASTASRREWSAMVLRQLDARAFEYRSTVFEFHAGANYRNFGLEAGLRERGAATVVVAEHLSQGQQLAFYANAGVPTAAPEGPVRRAQAGRYATGEYTALGAWLESLGATEATMTFGEIESLIGRSLPTSARRHSAWWANSVSGHSHAVWVTAGWRVRADLSLEVANFTRSLRP
jgi:hypothetical protein